MKTTYLTLVAIVRDQEHYIREWLWFHRLTGVERFVLYLHHCKDDTEKIIRSLPFKDDIHLRFIRDDKGKSCQMAAYRDGISDFRKKTKWFQFNDTDEYTYCLETTDTRKVLERYEQFGGLAVHWHHFGFMPDHYEKPAGLAIEAFRYRKEDDYHWNRCFKSFMLSETITGVLSTHVQESLRPVVREHFDSIETAFWRMNKSPSWDIIRCDHHFTRSIADFLERHRRGSCNMFRENRNKKYSVIDVLSRGSGEILDTSIQKFVPLLKEVMDTEVIR